MNTDPCLIQRPFGPWHPRPWGRLALALARTVRLLASPDPHNPKQALSAWAAGFLAAMHVEIRVHGPLPSNGQLWVCNHLSWLDPLICLALRPSAALAKAEVGSYPWVGRPAVHMGLRLVRREDPLSRAAALVRLCADLRDGEDLLVFPEGTTTLGDTLAPLQEGALRAAYRLGVTVLPIRLVCRDAHYPWTGDDQLPPHLVALARARTTCVHLHPGQVMNPRECASESQWVQAIRTHLAPYAHDLRGCA